MDRIKYYRELVKNILIEDSKIKPGDDIEAMVVFDDEQDSYQLMYIGWNGVWRMHSSIIHVRLRNGKIWIEYDGTEEGIATALLEQGITKDEIVLAFHSPKKREYTGFAVH